MFFLEILVDLRGQDPSQDGPKTLPNAPKTPPRRSQDDTTSPKAPQDVPKTGLGAIVSIFRRPDRILPQFWLDFGWFWNQCWKVW